MPKYENSIIYKLCHQNDLQNENIYIGSTTNFRMRKHQHKNSCNNEKNKYYTFKVYQYIRDNDGWNKWVMIPIEVFPCNDKKELEVRERHHIELLKSKLNIIIPTRTREEWIGDNKEKLQEYKKEYREANKEEIAEYKKKHYEVNKEYINQKVICEHCKAEINKQYLKRHQKTKKCIDSI